jgi:hypothetical protein
MVAGLPKTIVKIVLSRELENDTLTNRFLFFVESSLAKGRRSWYHGISDTFIGGPQSCPPTTGFL